MNIPASSEIGNVGLLTRHVNYSDVLAKDTGEVVREIPPAEMRELASKLEQLRGIFLNQTG